MSLQIYSSQEGAIAQIFLAQGEYRKAIAMIEVIGVLIATAALALQCLDHFGGD